MRKCVFPGTFDPFTVGHENIVKRASLIFDEVYILITTNSSKLPLLEANQRKKLITEFMLFEPDVFVVVAEYKLLVDDVKNIGANTIIKGIRNPTDFQYESDMALINKQLDNNIETVFMNSDPTLSQISSSAYKELVTLGADPRWAVDAKTHKEYTYRLT